MRNYFEAFDVQGLDELDSTLAAVPSELLPELKAALMAERSNDGELGFRRLLEYPTAHRRRGVVVVPLPVPVPSEPEWDDAA